MKYFELPTATKIPAWGILLFLFICYPFAAHASILDIVISVASCTGNGFTANCSVDEKKLFASIACKVMQQIDKAIIPIYCQIVYHPTYIAFLNSLAVLYMILIGVGFITGTLKMKLGEVFIALVKIIFIYFILSNAGFFFSFVYKAVLDTPTGVIKSILAMHGSSAQNIFEYVDEGMYKIFNEVFKPEAAPEDRVSHVATELSIVAIALGIKQFVPGGNFIYGLFIFVIVGWIFTYLSVVIRYLLAYMSITFLLMLAPIFLPSLLFRKTSYLWDEWLKYLISFLIEIIIVVAFVIMIEKFYTEFFDMLKKGMNDIKLENQDTVFLKQYNDGNSNYGSVLNGGLGDSALNQFEQGQGGGRIRQEDVQSIADPTAALNKAGFQGDATKITSDFMIQLVTMAVVVFLSRVFLSYIPSFAGMLAGQFRFSKNFGGEAFGQSGGAGRTNLFGQTGYGSSQNSLAAEADGKGGIWQDLGISQIFR